MTEQLVAIGTDLGSCWRRITEIQDECIDLPEHGSREDGRKRIRLKRDERCLAERTWALESMATQLRATSLTEAIVQAVMAHRFLGDLMESDLDEAERQATGRSIERLLYSLVECLETEAEARRDEMFGTSYMPRDRDPFGSVRDALATPPGQTQGPEKRAPGRPRNPAGEAGAEEDVLV